MGKRGPAAKPTKLKLLHGEKRPSRINYAEPQPEAGAPDAPEWLDPEARAVWDHIVAGLEPTGVLCRVDRDSLAVYCEAVVHHRRAAELVDRTGPLIKGRGKDALVKNPAMQIVRDNAAIVRAFAQEFGLTPAARTQLSTPGRRDDALDASRLLS